MHSGVPETPPSASAQFSYLGDQLGSFLFSQSHWLLHSASLDNSLMAWRRTCPLIPRSFMSLTVDVATKPRHPTSAGQTFALQPRCSSSVARSEYRSFFLSNASCTASSQGTVSSTKYTLRCELDHRTRSGRRLVMTIAGGTVSRWPTSTSISQSLAASSSPNLALGGNFRCPCCPSRTNAIELAELVPLGGRALMVVLLLSRIAAKPLSTWLCLQVYRPWERPTLHPTRMCLSVAGVEHRGHDGSSPSHWWRFLGVGRTS